jgi:hypothetical protein
VGAIWTVISVGLFLRDDFLSLEQQARLKGPVVAHLLSWQVWTIATLLIVIGWLFEAAFRSHRGMTAVTGVGTRRLKLLFRDKDVAPWFPTTDCLLSRFFVGVQNIGEITLDDVSVRALNNEFVEGTISRAHARDAGNHYETDINPIVIALPSLHPGAIEYQDLFHSKYNCNFVDVVLTTGHSFTIEAKARDTITVTANFEYDPRSRPRVRMLERD